MAEVATYAPGTPVWADLGVEDWEAAKAFYGKLFGWEAREAEGHDDHDWTYQVVGDKKVAGIGVIKEWEPKGWTPFMLTADCKATAAAAEAAGGKILAAPAGGDEGWQAILADPCGAVFAIWQPGWWDMTGDVFNAPGAICWNELICQDTKTETSFYEKVFGWKGSERDGYCMWNMGEKLVAGMQPGDAAATGYWLTYFGVTDCDKAVAQAESLGATVTVAPRDIQQGRVAVLEDPWHNRFAVFQS